MNNLMNISQLIFEKSIISAEQLKSELNNTDEKERDLTWTYIVFEFIYLFLHLINREIFYSDKKEIRYTIMSEIGVFTVNNTINTLYEKMPENLQKKAEEDFLEKAQKAELEYGACKKILDTNTPFSDHAVISLFGKNIIRLMNKTDDIFIMLKTMTLAMQSWLNIKSVLDKELNSK